MGLQVEKLCALAQSAAAGEALGPVKCLLVTEDEEWSSNSGEMILTLQRSPILGVNCISVVLTLCEPVKPLTQMAKTYIDNV